MFGVRTRYIHNYVTPELFNNVMCSFGTYVYELIHVYVVTLSFSDSVVNFEVIEGLIVFVWYPVSMDTTVSLLHPQLSMLIKLQFFDIYQCIQVISMKKDILSGNTPVIA